MDSIKENFPVHAIFIDFKVKRGNVIRTIKDMGINDKLIRLIKVTQKSNVKSGKMTETNINSLLRKS